LNILKSGLVKRHYWHPLKYLLTESEMSSRSVAYRTQPDNISVRHKPVIFRSVWAIFAAVIIQRVPFIVLAPDSLVELKKALLILSYLLLGWALLRNINYRSVYLVLIGVLLNFIAIVANGGLMPVSPEARTAAGLADLGNAWLGHVTPYTTGIYLPVVRTNLWLLTDIIPVPQVKMVLSVGDIVLGIGLILLVIELFCYLKYRNTGFKDANQGL
jgi:hypothetical protein